MPQMYRVGAEQLCVETDIIGHYSEVMNLFEQ